MEKKIHLAVLTSVPLPVGMAASNRILSYSKGLVELGNNVSIYTSNLPQGKAQQEFNGIDILAFRKRNNFPLFNKMQLPIAVIRMISRLIKNRKKHDRIILVSNSAVLIILSFIASKLTGLKLVQEKSEFPFVLNNRSLIGRVYAFFYVNYIYKVFDGMIIMTKPLEEYFERRTRKSCKKIVVPMTVEPERFENVISSPSMQNCITYCGHMGGNKDGLMNLISAFEIIQNKFPDYKLFLIGSADEDELTRLKAFAEDLGVKNIIFYGQVTRDEMPVLLANSKMLVLARPSSLQSTGGFPTKLGEYLSTGKPVVVTSVGDIPNYLKNKEHAYLVKPDDIKGFAEAMEFVLNNYDEALVVGSQGNQLTRSTFNYFVQSKRIYDFLLDL